MRRVNGRVWIAVLLLVGFPVFTMAVESAADSQSALQGYRSANGLLHRELYELAVEEYRAFLKTHPAHEKSDLARYGLSVSLFRLGRYEDTVAQLKRLGRAGGFEYAPEAATMLGQSHLALEQFGKAADAFRAMLKLHSDHALGDKAGAGLVESLYRAGRAVECVAAADSFLKHWPKSSLRERSDFFAALASMQRRAYGDASKRFELQLKRFPKGSLTQQASLLLAQCYQQDGALAQAVRQYRRVVSTVSGRFLPDAMLGLARLLQQTGEPKEAGRLLDKLIERNPKGALLSSSHLLRGRVWFDQQKFPKAIDEFKQATDSALADQAEYWLAKSELRLGESAHAARRLGEAMERFPESELLAEMSYDRGVALLRAKDDDAALRSLRSFRKDFAGHPLAPDALHLMALTQHQRKKYRESGEYCSTFLSQYPKHDLASPITFLAAENDFLVGESEEAIEGFRRFLKRFPDGAQAARATFRLGTALYRVGEFDQAVEFLSESAKAARADATFAPTLLALGDIYFQRSEWKTAERFLTLYLDAGGDLPSSDDALLKLGLAQQRQGRFDEALTQYDALLERFEHSSHRQQASFERGQALMVLDRIAEARESFQAVVTQAEPDSRFAPHALNHLGTIAMKQGDSVKAAELFARAAKTATSSSLVADALFQNAQALMTANKFADAEKAFDRLLEDHDATAHHAKARARRAIAIARQDRYEDAVKALSRVERVDADSLEPELLSNVRYEKAWCLRELGRMDEAVESYGMLLSASGEDSLNAHAVLELAGIHLEGGRYADAGNLLRTLQDEIESKGVKVSARVQEQVLYRLAVCEFELGRMEEAVDRFETFLSNFSDSSLSASACYYAGESHFRLQHFGEARKHLARVVKEFRDDAVYEASLLRLGEALASRQRWSRSERVFTEFVERFGKSPQAYQARYGIGWARQNQKRFPEAVSAYRAVVARHQGPTAARAQFQIGECYFAQKKYGRAVRELLKVDILYAYPQWSAAALFEAGRCFEKLGKTVEARRHFKQVADGHKDSQWAAMATQRLSELSSAGLPGR